MGFGGKKEDSCAGSVGERDSRWAYSMTISVGCVEDLGGCFEGGAEYDVVDTETSVLLAFEELQLRCRTP